MHARLVAAPVVRDQQAACNTRSTPSTTLAPLQLCADLISAPGVGACIHNLRIPTALRKLVVNDATSAISLLSSLFNDGLLLLLKFIGSCRLCCLRKTADVPQFTSRARAHAVCWPRTTHQNDAVDMI